MGNLSVDRGPNDDPDQLVAALAAAYAEGRSVRRGTSGATPERSDPGIASLGAGLRSAVLSSYKGRYADSGVRVFAIYGHEAPRNWWVSDLFAALTHTGIVHAWGLHDDPRLATRLEVFRPTVVLAGGSGDYAASPAPSTVAAFKRRHGLFRLLNPPHPTREPSGELDADGRDRLRRDLDGELADAHFWPFVREYYDERLPEWSASGFPYLEMISAVNPDIHYPERATRDLDYFIVAGRDPRRPVTAVECLAPIMRRYRGIWGGPGWGFGEGRIAAADTRSLYARTKIAPNPLHPHLVAGPADITHRTFAAAASGAFVLTQLTPVTRRFFADDEIVATGDAAAFVDAFDHYVERPREREAFVRRALERVFGEHTTLHRVDALVRFVADHRDLA